MCLYCCEGLFTTVDFFNSPCYILIEEDDMAKLRIKHFGPITEGCDSDDGFITFDKYTLFIGDQGTGKSTVAKLFAICSWLEKAFFRDDYNIDEFDNLDFDELCHSQLLNYSFNENTEIEYAGDAYHFLFKKGAFLAEEIKDTIKKYKRPKIMYIPSERNILSVVKNIEELENLPPMLRLLRKRYLQASESLQNNGLFNLPLTGYKAMVNKSNGETSVIDEKTGKSVPLICASSGLQSIVPSTLVTQFLMLQSEQSILEKIRGLSDKNLNQLQLQLDNETVQDELERYIKSGITKSVSEKSLKQIESAARKFTNTYFLNIVEEPEQNLFPESQMKNLAFLLGAANSNDTNKIVITTHSPYMLSYITLAAKAYELAEKNVPSVEIEKIVSRESWIDGNKCCFYQIENGQIKQLPTFDRGLPSDNNMLNLTLGESNDKFDQLLDLEEEVAG